MIRRVVVALALLAGLAHAAETPIPAAPTRWVTDQAGLLSPATRDELDHRLEQYQQSTGHQVIVWIGTTLGDAPIDDWSAKAFAKGQLGRKGKDDGVAIFVFATDHRARIEVGYGLEDKLPDAYAARILQDTLEPNLKAGHADVAITGTVAGVLDRLGDETAGAIAVKPAVRPATWGSGRIVEVVFGVIIVIFVIGMAITHPQLALLLLQIISSFGGGGGGGFGSGGGGGFSGGGGRSGGGGASGSW